LVLVNEITGDVLEVFVQRFETLAILEFEGFVKLVVQVSDPGFTELGVLVLNDLLYVLTDLLLIVSPHVLLS
jgi:hypothetical protein